MVTAGIVEGWGIEPMNCCLEPAAAVPEDEAAVVRPGRTAYGSMNPGRLADWHRQMDREIEAGAAPTVIVDLDGVEYAGAAFVGVLAEAAGRLRSQNRLLTIRGDRFGLLATAGLSSLLASR